jgi:hypothetical protein
VLLTLCDMAIGHIEIGLRIGRIHSFAKRPCWRSQSQTPNAETGVAATTAPVLSITVRCRENDATMDTGSNASRVEGLTEIATTGTAKAAES